MVCPFRRIDFSGIPTSPTVNSVLCASKTVSREIDSRSPTQSFPSPTPPPRTRCMHLPFCCNRSWLKKASLLSPLCLLQNSCLKEAKPACHCHLPFRCKIRWLKEAQPSFHSLQKRPCERVFHALFCCKSDSMKEYLPSSTSRFVATATGCRAMPFFHLPFGCRSRWGIPPLPWCFWCQGRTESGSVPQLPWPLLASPQDFKGARPPFTSHFLAKAAT